MNFQRWRITEDKEVFVTASHSILYTFSMLDLKFNYYNMVTWTHKEVNLGKGQWVWVQGSVS